MSQAHLALASLARRSERGQTGWVDRGVERLWGAVRRMRQKEREEDGEWLGRRGWTDEELDRGCHIPRVRRVVGSPWVRLGQEGVVPRLAV